MSNGTVDQTTKLHRGILRFAYLESFKAKIMLHFIVPAILYLKTMPAIVLALILCEQFNSEILKNS